MITHILVFSRITIHIQVYRKVLYMAISHCDRFSLSKYFLPHTQTKNTHACTHMHTHTYIHTHSTGTCLMSSLSPTHAWGIHHHGNGIVQTANETAEEIYRKEGSHVTKGQ